MDPVANIGEQISLALEIQLVWDRVGEDGLSQEDAAQVAESANRLAELVTALHEWRTNGGFDPYAPLREKFRDDEGR